MTTPTLQLHIGQEFDDINEYDVPDIVSLLREQRSDIQDRMTSIRDDMMAVQALENFAGSIANKETLTAADIKRYNELIETQPTTSITGVNYRQVSLESFDSLVNTASSVFNTASNVSNKALTAASVIKEGLVSGASLAKELYDRVQSSIVKIAASWDFVCSMIEKRWFGLSQLVKVYELQHQKLQISFEDITHEKNALAFFSVKLYVAKLRNDGRDISKKDNLIKALVSDSGGIAELGASFVKYMQEIKKIDAYSSQALKLSFPYKIALAMNANTINGILKELSKNALFYEGGFTKPYQAQSRVLLGGKVININYNEEDIKEDSIRKDVKVFISNLSFTSIKRRDGNSNDTENIGIEAMTVSEASTIFTSVAITNEALKSYQESNVPAMLKSRTSMTSLITFATGLTGGDAAFDTIKRFFQRDDNLKAFNLVAPAAVSSILGTFLTASSFAVFGTIVAASAAAFLIDYLRKYIISNLFSMMDLQYKITDIIERFDHDYVDTLIEIHNQGYRMCKKLALHRNWET
jgi:hypothetical protein